MNLKNNVSGEISRIVTGQFSRQKIHDFFCNHIEGVRSDTVSGKMKNIEFQGARFRLSLLLRIRNPLARKRTEAYPGSGLQHFVVGKIDITDRIAYLILVFFAKGTYKPKCGRISTKKKKVNTLRCCSKCRSSNRRRSSSTYGKSRGPVFFRIQSAAFKSTNIP